MGDALDSAWALIEPALREQAPTTIESARRLLADSILSSVAAGVASPDILRDEAIRVVKRNFPQHMPQA